MTIGKLGLSSMSVGIMSAALDEAVAYANQHEQRGHAIIDFQAIHYLIAETVSRTEACRQLLYWAATCKDQGAQAIAEVASAKLFISQTAVDVCRMAMSVHGVYGIAEGMPIERMFRDAKMYELLEGTSEVQARTRDASGTLMPSTHASPRAGPTWSGAARGPACRPGNLP